MIQLLQPEFELVVKSGFVYVPLLFDSDIAREVRGRPDTGGQLGKQTSEKSQSVIDLDGRPFIKSVSIQSLLANYERIDKGHYENLRRKHIPELSEPFGLEAISPSDKLQTIILKIMPHFIRQRRGFKRAQLSDEELMNLVCSKLDIPQEIVEKADSYLDSGPLLQALNELDRLDQNTEPLSEGRLTGEALREWLQKALKAQIVAREKARLSQGLRERERFGESERNYIATLMCIAQKGSFELDGFGFFRIGSSDDYFVYKRTGEYILKDYYARSYRFPDCRVAVPTRRPFRAYVLETYKHPFLLGHAPNQEICLSGYNWPDKFTAEDIIKLLEEGINALLYGYNSRRRNGYHSLDPTLYYVKTIEFQDYRI